MTESEGGLKNTQGNSFPLIFHADKNDTGHKDRGKKEFSILALKLWELDDMGARVQALQVEAEEFKKKLSEKPLEHNFHQDGELFLSVELQERKKILKQRIALKNGELGVLEKELLRINNIRDDLAAIHMMQSKIL